MDLVKFEPPTFPATCTHSICIADELLIEKEELQRQLARVEDSIRQIGTYIILIRWVHSLIAIMHLRSEPQDMACSPCTCKHLFGNLSIFMPLLIEIFKP